MAKDCRHSKLIIPKKLNEKNLKIYHKQQTFALSWERMPERKWLMKGKYYWGRRWELEIREKQNKGLFKCMQLK